MFITANAFPVYWLTDDAALVKYSVHTEHIAGAAR